MDYKALTIRAEGILRVLTTSVAISEPFVGDMPGKEISSRVFRAIWDTGASHSVITKAVAVILGLKPTGVAEVHTASGIANQNTYLVNIVLPMNVVVQSVRVTEGILQETDVLIGMDIITLGDFSVTNHIGKTIMTFRIPSCGHVDFVQEFQNRASR